MHDIGKLGVSNRILDKPGKPTSEEFEQIRKHPPTRSKFSNRWSAFGVLADVAVHIMNVLMGTVIIADWRQPTFRGKARVLVVADVFEAMSAKRPYRDALPWDKIFEIMSDDTGRGFDHECVQALARWHDRHQMESRIELQLREVDRLLSEV